MWRFLGNQIGVGDSLSNMGHVYYATGQYMAARESYNQALDIHHTIGNRAGEASARHGLGKTDRSLGNFESARSLFEEALTFFQTIGDYHRQAHVLSDLGFVYCRQEVYETALVFLEEAVLLLKELNAPWWTLVEALTYYSWTLHNMGRLQEAKQQITEALEIERDAQRKVAMVEDMLHLGRIAFSLNDLALADTCARQVLYYVEHQGVRGIEHPAMVYLTCYQILRVNEKIDQAQAVLIEGQQYVAAQSSQIEDPLLRERYLFNVPENREIQALVLVPC